jgi:uncharacterized phage-associated protein
MNMPYNSLDVASLIVKLCKEFEYDYNNTKIQKLLYCCYGAVLAAEHKRLCDEFPRAWQYGPVFPRVFNFINKKGVDALLSRSSVADFSPELLAFLRKVIELFGTFNASSLSKWTHQEDSPWYKTIYELGGEKNGFIPDALIEEYFSKNVVR